MNIKELKVGEVIPFLLIVCLFILLLFHNPFSTRNLISNLDPFPDSIHYLNPPMSFLKGEGFRIVREGRSISTSVPPLYSIVLLPVFLITNDPRAFYFINILLALLSFGGMFILLRKLTTNNLIRYLALLVYVTSFFIYWYPTVPMSENLTLPLFIGSLILLLTPESKITAILAGFLASSFYFTKYASVPLTLGFSLTYFLKIVLSGDDEKVKNAFLFVGSSFLSFIAFSLLDSQTKETNSLLQLITTLFPNAVEKGSSSVSPDNAEFSLSHLSTNLPQYVSAILGKPVRLLWYFDPIINPLVGIFGLVGLVAGLFSPKKRIISLGLLSMLIFCILFMSTFYAVDARYIYTAIPTLIIGTAILFDLVWRKIEKNKQVYFMVGIGVVAVFYLSKTLIPLKNQIALNFRHTETPWSYMSVVAMNTYFNTYHSAKEPVLITALPPYYIDFFLREKVILLPLSKDQEFRKYKDQAWGKQDYSNLISLYGSYLNRGYTVFVDNAALGNEGYLHADFNNIRDNFYSMEVLKGCFDTCNIYKLSKK